MKVLGVSLILFLVLACMLPIAPVQAQPVNVKLVRVYWEEGLQPKPGDKNLPLHVVLLNADTATINYLKAKLKLYGTPFTSSEGEAEAYAGGYSIPPGGMANLTFLLNVKSGAKLQAYTASLELNLITSKYASGVDVSLPVEIPLYGEVKLSASLQPWEVSPGIRTVRLEIENQGEAEASDVKITVSPTPPLALAGGDGFYTLEKVEPSRVEALDLKLHIPASLAGGSGSLSLKISYRDSYGNRQVEAKSLSLKVLSLREWFSVEVSPGTVRPEVNKVTFTLSNQGDGEASDVEVKLTLPQTLSLLQADNLWRFERIPAGGEASFQAEIYASTMAVGTAAQATLTITYKAGGITRSEVKVLGFKVGGKTVSPVKLRVADVGWGSLGNPVGVSPGDEGAPLYVALQNLGSHTIVGVRGELELKPPFTGTAGENRVSAVLPSLQPGQTGSLQFTLNISPEAEIKSYQLKLKVEYLILNEVSSPVSYVEAPPETFTVQVPLYGRPVLDVSLDQRTLTAGEASTLNFKVRNVGTGDVIDLNILLQLPSAVGVGKPPMVLVGGDNLWHFNRVNAGGEVGFKALVRVGKEAAGTYQLTLNLTYRDEWGKIHSETRSLGVYVSPRAPGSQVLVTSYRLDPETVYKGEDFTLTLTVENVGSSEAQQVTVQLTAPQGFSTLTPSTVNLGSLRAGEARTVEYRVKSSPTASEGVVYTFMVDLGYMDELGVLRTSRSLLGVPLHGKVELAVYDVGKEPAAPGSLYTLTFTLLNKGTTTATYTMLAVVAEEPFTPVEEENYIGDLDPNAPLPVSLKVRVSPSAEEGEYKVKVKVYYKDEYNEDHTSLLTIPVKVLKVLPVKPGKTPTPSPLPGRVGPQAFLLLPVIAAIIVVLAVGVGVLFWRRRRREKRI